ncbi:MAG: type IV pilus secretin PilQ [Candidatus Alcyoniella australis]|nr:type IV pilus secretin PilQ [Candidatus Alcyoniella australis]
MVIKGESPLDLTQDIRQQQWIGSRITLDTQNADIKSVLRIIAEEADLNIVAGDDVSGKISVKLINVPWDQALDLILKSRQLDMVQDGNVIRVAPRATLQSEQKALLAERRTKLENEELVLALIPVNYSDASSLEEQLRTILSNRGSISVDVRTNVVIIRDVLENVEQAKVVARLLDRTTQQVLIEARIVEATSDFSREMGIKWGGRYIADAAHGNPTGMAFPNSVDVTGAGESISNVPSANYVVNLPAPVGLGSGGGLGLTMGSVNSTFALDLQLSAMENRGEGRVISQPRISTMENVAANIKQGITFPTAIRMGDDVGMSYIDAFLELTVEPKVTSEDSVMMVIHIAKDAPNTSIATSTGYPPIDKKEANTTALVMDGETTVIGGIFQTENTSTTLGIPWLSRIPVLGFFFRDKRMISKRTELLIFITPRIIRDKPLI